MVAQRVVAAFGWDRLLAEVAVGRRGGTDVVGRRPTLVEADHAHVGAGLDDLDVPVGGDDVGAPRVGVLGRGPSPRRAGLGSDLGGPGPSRVELIGAAAIGPVLVPHRGAVEDGVVLVHGLVDHGAELGGRGRRHRGDRGRAGPGDAHHAGQGGGAHEAASPHAVSPGVRIHGDGGDPPRWAAETSSDPAAGGRRRRHVGQDEVREVRSCVGQEVITTCTMVGRRPVTRYPRPVGPSRRPTMDDRRTLTRCAAAARSGRAGSRDRRTRS